MRDSGTSVFLEVLLGDTVEGECRDATLQARSGDTPVTVGTAPAGELFVFDPDHASQMFDPYWMWDSERNSRWRRETTREMREFERERELMSLAEGTIS